MRVGTTGVGESHCLNEVLDVNSNRKSSLRIFAVAGRGGDDVVW